MESIVLIDREHIALYLTDALNLAVKFAPYHRLAVDIFDIFH